MPLLPKNTVAWSDKNLFLGVRGFTWQNPLCSQSLRPIWRRPYSISLSGIMWHPSCLFSITAFQFHGSSVSWLITSATNGLIQFPSWWALLNVNCSPPPVPNYCVRLLLSATSCWYQIYSSYFCDTVRAKPSLLMLCSSFDVVYTVKKISLWPSYFGVCAALMTWDDKSGTYSRVSCITYGNDLCEWWARTPT